MTMALKYADRMAFMKASEIRELLKLTQQPDIISFAGGVPAPELFPIEEMKKISQEVLENNGTVALQYGPTEGYHPLREKISERMKRSHMDVEAEEILITTGSQQGLDFSGKIFINPKDKIICEKPTYLGAINAFRAYNPEFIDIEMDDEGMQMNQLESALKENDNVKFIYVIPDFQNPTGKTWSIERRKALVHLANRYDVAIIEDNPYGELRYKGAINPAIKHFDTEGRVIFLGTFSKTFCPGLRIGWVAASPEILNKYVLVKQGADLQSNSMAQMELNVYLQNYNLDAHIEKIKDVYVKRKETMIDVIKKAFPEGIKFTNPDGGLFTWIELPSHMNTRELAIKALEKKVAYVPGGSFFANGGHENTMRLNYSNMNEEKIEEGMLRLAEVIKEELAKSPN